MNTKYIFVTGGVVSGLGKGITAASLGRLLKNRGYKVTIQKFDPYINVDPGTMSPYEHGEVFVTDDGAETDLDLGHYERFIDENLTKNSSVTSGRIYQNVIKKERRGDYLGKTVQVIPHITNEIKENIYSFENSDIDVVITELGGTVGDIEGLAFIEAIRQVGLEKNPEDVLYIHVTLLPHISGSNELKSKPTQHSVKELQSFGIKPDILVCRTEQVIPDEMRNKIALFCNVRPKCVVQNLTADNLYAVPLMLEKEGLAEAACEHLQLDKIKPENQEWEQMIEKIGINKATIDRNRPSKKGEKDKRSTLYNAIIELEKQKIYLKMIDKALKNPNDKSSKEVINSVRDVMKNVCSIKDFSKSNIEDFVKTIKCYNLRYGLLDAKFLGFKGMLYNLKAKDILAQQINGNITEDEYKALKPEVLFGYVTENKKVSKSKINGQDSVRIVIKGKDDIGSMQFHLQKKDVLDALKDYNMEIEENEKLEDAVSISVPYSNEKGKEYVKNNRGDLGWETIENFENFDKNTFTEITKKMIKKLALITKLNKEKKGEEIKI